MNLPNKLTVFRIILVPIMVLIPYFNIQGEFLGIPISWVIIDVIFIIAAITDKLDGTIARKRNLITNFGKFLDPIADKILGEWKTIGNPCVDDGASTTYNTQSTCVYQIAEGEYIYMGDRWFSNNLKDSRYVWLPIEFDSKGYISIKKY